jgi:ATP adenylyltransferase
MEWVKKEDRNQNIDGCVFCELPQLAADDENLILLRSADTYVLLNNAPYTPGHMLVIPHNHVKGFHEMSDREILDHGRVKRIATRALKSSMYPDGLNMGTNQGEAGGASVTDHVHTHIVPRWNGDTTFMPITADTRVIEESVEDTYKHLREALAEFNETKGRESGRAIELRETTEQPDR